MSSAEIMDEDQLLQAYPDDLWRDRFVRLSDLTDALGECIIRRNYTVPDELNQAIQLTAYGQKFLTELLQKYGVGKPQGASAPLKPNDARLMCALSMHHVGLLLDVEKTNIEAIEAVLDAQVKADDIRFPNFLGRDLYDWAAETFPTERTSLSVEETDELLIATGRGIAQFGIYLIGPFGLMESAQRREISASRRVPMFHCADLECGVVHRTRVTTDLDAPVNQYRDKLRKALDKDSNQASEWGSFYSEISGDRREVFNEASSARACDVRV